MSKPALPQSVDIAGESVAGEEDPGASIDMTMGAMSPADEAMPGTPGTGEDVCRTCGGTGQLNGGACPDCDGTGKITVGIGGA
jgi:hypothetical protein